MTVVALPGCRSTPLLSYLQGLGVLRILHEQQDSGLVSHWEGSTLRIDSNLTRETITTFFLEHYQPMPIVSPWNNRCATALRSTRRTGVGARGIAAIETSQHPRFAPLQTTIEKARQLLKLGNRSGWVDNKGKIESKTKKVFLTACRAVFPDEALDWLDAAVVLSEDKPQYPILLGTGGNLGSGDISLNFLDMLADLLLNPKRTRRSGELLTHALFEEGHPRLEGKPVGQFAPGAAGTMNSWALDGKQQVVNPWSLVLAMEGASLFASGIARRFNGSRGLATTPFTVFNNPAGYLAAEGEKVKGEFWAPLWQHRLTVPELRRIFAEGRISWSGRHAANGLDAAKALSSLGVDRGLGSFERYVIAERFGQSPLAVPVGSFVVARQPADRVSLLGETDRWVDRIRRQTLPAAAASTLRRIDAAQIRIAQRHTEPEPLQAFLAELAALEWIISRNPDLRTKVGSPIPPLDRDRWVRALEDDTPEWRLAVAVATQRDRLAGTISELEQRRGTVSVFLRPVQLGKNPKYLQWATRNTADPSPSSVVDRLAAALVTRSLACRDRKPNEEITVVGSGSLVAFDQAASVGMADLAAFLNRQVDDQRLGQLISVAALLDGYPSVRHTTLDGPSDISTAKAILGPFYHRWPVKIPTDDSVDDSEELQRRLVPSLSWPQKLQAGRVEEVMREAIMRLAAAGFNPGVRPEFIYVSWPRRLLASLFIPVYTTDVQHGIRKACPPTEGEIS